MGLFKSLTKLTENVLDIATAPVAIAVETVRVTTEPLAKMANDVSGAIGEMADDVSETMKDKKPNGKRSRS